MTDLASLLQQSSAHAWLFVPSAILLGALHGLEPGHSKTMMAAFIVAIRGTVFQAVLLGLSATISHTAVVWAVALLGLYFGQGLSGERSEAYLHLASAVIITGVAAWMVWRLGESRTRWQNEMHDHHHHDEQPVITLDGRTLSIEVFEDRWRIRSEASDPPPADVVRLTTVRADGAEQTFVFGERDGYLESLDEIPEPHAFKARIMVAGETVEALFEEQYNHDQMELSEQDAHARAHAADISKRFARADRDDTADRTVRPDRRFDSLPGRDYGAAALHPAEAAFARLRPGALLRYRTSHHHGFGRCRGRAEYPPRPALLERVQCFAPRAPYASAALIVLVGLYTGWSGLLGPRS
jgi:nickel/cobalt exporter